MQCVILAGGRGTRLLPKTEKVPKSMIRVRGKPFLEYQIGLLRDQGVDEVILCVGYLQKQIESFFQKGERFGVRITYSYERGELRGTGGALKNAAGLLADVFLTLYGDSYLETDYQAIYRHYFQVDSPVLMAVFRNENRYQKSNVVFEDGLVKIYDKNDQIPNMDYIDYGLSVVSKGILKEIPEGIRSNLADLYRNLARDGKLAGYEVRNRFYEIGSPGGLKDFEDYISQRGIRG